MMFFGTVQKGSAVLPDHRVIAVCACVAEVGVLSMWSEAGARLYSAPRA